MSSEVEQTNSATFVQFLIFGLNSDWRRLSDAEREQNRTKFSEALKNNNITTYTYSLIGLKANAELLLWRAAQSLDRLQDSAGSLMRTGLGHYLEIRHSLIGMTRPSIYVHKATPQEQAVGLPDRKRYMIVYPFTKTPDWYLLSRDSRQRIMNEHIRVGRQYPSVRQLLVYSFGLDDQEFVVAYETDDLKSYQDLVMALREVEARRFTLRDTPIYTAIHRSVNEALSLLG